MLLLHHASGRHQGVCMIQKRDDASIHLLQSGRSSLVISVIDRQHHGLATLAVEDPGQSILHAPVQETPSLDGPTIFIR